MVQVAFGMFFVVSGTPDTYHSCPFKDEKPWKWRVLYNDADFVLATQTTFPADKWTFIKEADVEDGTISGEDNIKLHYWYVPGDAAKPTVLISHGRGMCMGKYEVVLRMNMLHRAGYNVMAIELRNHGGSDNNAEKLYFWGTEEYKDYLTAIKFLEDKKSATKSRIGIMGSSFSGGVSAVVMGMEPTIKAAWVDSPACDPKAILVFSANNIAGGVLKGIVPPTVEGVFKSYTSKSKSPVEELIGVEQVKKLREDQHMYFVGGSADQVVPFSVTEACYNNAMGSPGGVKGNVEKWFPDIETQFNLKTKSGKYQYTNSHVVDELYLPEDYEKRMLGFFNRTICAGKC